MRHAVSCCLRLARSVVGPSLLGAALLGAPAAQAQEDCTPNNMFVSRATATWSQECGIVFTPGMIFDGNTNTSWALAHCDGTGDRSLTESVCVETNNDLVATTTPIRVTLKMFSGAFFPGEGGGNLTVGRFALAYTSDPRDQFADGLARNGQMGANWTPLTPDTATAHWADGAGNLLPPNGQDPTITIEPEGTLLVSGNSPQYAVYEVTFTFSHATVTGFKIDFIDENGVDESAADGLPTGGPGRHGNGNLLLWEAVFGFVRVPTITQEPADGRPCNGAPYTLSVGVDGQGPFSYQWRRLGSPISGATGSTYQVDLASSTATYDCVITAPCGNLTTRAATVNAACRADYNCDGFVDFFDYDDYVTGYQAGDIAADCNGDEFIDFFDYDCFTSAFQQGC